MKKFFLTLAVVMMTLAASAKDITKNIDVSNSCNGISVGSFYKVELTKSNSASLKVIVDEELEPYIIAKVSNGTIILRLDGDRMPWRLRNNASGHTLRAEISLKELERVEMSGSSQMSCSGIFNTDNFDCDLSGATKLYGLNINGKYASCDISGATEAEISGRFEKVDYEMSGASQSNLDISSTTADFDVSGASQCRLKGDFNTISFGCSGASSCDLKGKSSYAEFDCSGASKIYAMDMAVKMAEIDASGASHLDVTVSEGLTVELSGASHLTYSAPQGVNPDVREIGRGCSLHRK